MPVPLRGELTPQTLLVSDLTGSVDGRIKSMISRMLMITPNTRQQALSAEDSETTGSSHFSPVDLHAAESTIDPLLLSVAAARRDPSLKNILRALLTESEAGEQRRSQGIALLNTFATLSPLHIACLHAILDNVRALVEAGASVHVRDVQGHTPLFYACNSLKGDTNEKLAIIGVLQSAGAHLTTAEVEQSRAGSAKDILSGLGMSSVAA